MAWNEPGKGRDPWGGNGQQQGPPDLDELVRKLQNRLRALFGGGGGSGGDSAAGGAGGSGPLLILIVALAVVGLVWLSAYRVDAPEEGIVLRLGAYHRTSPPGLHFRIPFVETVEKVNTAKIDNFSYENQMLTADENIVYIEADVQYRRWKPIDFLFNVRDPELTLEEVAESAIREIVGKNNASFILEDGRAKVADDAVALMQETLNYYNAGILVTQLNLVDAQPPPEVQAAVDDATKAREDKERFRLAGEAYANDVVPRARGAAAREIQEAEAHRDRAIAEAQGEADRFIALLNEYEKAPEVTRRRLYLETIEEVYRANGKIIMDTDGSGNNLLYLPVDKLLEEARQSVATENLDAMSSTARSVTPEPGTRTRENLRSRDQR